ncbi:MAG: enoyl-CoA hydratase-related protein [Ferrimicrobium sp.]
MEALRLERDGAIATMHLARPQRLNAFGRAFFEEFPRVLGEVARDSSIGALIIAADGPHFCAGLDIREMSASNEATTSLGEIHALQTGFYTLATFPKPTIATVCGYCIGGGVDLIAACDIRLAADDAQFSIREVRIGMVADLGSLQLLPTIMPRGILAELALTGRNFSADEALRYGLVTHVYPNREHLDDAARKLARTIVANPSGAVQGTKRVLNRAYETHLAAGLEEAAAWNAPLLNGPEVRAAIAAFVDRDKDAPN